MFQGFSVHQTFRVDHRGVDEEEVVSVSEVEQEKSDRSKAHHERSNGRVCDGDDDQESSAR